VPGRFESTSICFVFTCARAMIFVREHRRKPLSERLNHRPTALISHALKHPNNLYEIQQAFSGYLIA
jgi:hypothetical protein